MKNRKMCLMALIIFFGFFIGKVSAATELHQTFVVVDGQYVVKVYKNAVTGRINKAKSKTEYLTIKDENGNTYVAFCLDFGTPLTTDFSSYDDNAQTNIVEITDLYDYLKNSGKFDSNLSVIDAMIKRLSYLYYFGYKEGDAVRGTPTYYLATQAMMWEYLGSKGLYLKSTALDLEDLFDPEDLDVAMEGEGAPANLYNLQPEDIRFLKYTGSIPSTIPTDSSRFVDMSAAKTNIENSIAQYETKPSICDRSFEYAVGADITLSDNNNVLSNYTVTECSNDAVCTKDGNKLKVNPGTNTGRISITLERQEGLDLPRKVYQARRVTNEGNGLGQGVGVVGGPLEKMSCSLTVNVTEKPSGCYICDGEYEWTDNPGESCELQEEITTEANCKPEPEPQCYVCKNNSYKWSIDNPDADNCEAHPEIHEANCVFTPQTSGSRIVFVSLMCGLAAALTFMYFNSKKESNE